MKLQLDPIVNLYIMQSLTKGFSVFYFVLLPVFYAEKLIDSTKLGYIGGLFIILLIIGAVIVSSFLHSLQTNRLLQISSFVSICASIILFVGALHKDIFLLVIAYALMGLSVGTAMSGVNAFAAQVTTRGDRYKSLANLGMLTDIVRIVFPLLVSAAVALGALSAAIVLIILAATIFFIFSFIIPHSIPSKETIIRSVEEGIQGNRNFLYVLLLEFFDSFASSQLFVFLPLVFLAKGYSLGSSLLLQSFVFLGYMCGRWFVSVIARRYSGLKAVAYAEFGMVASILFLLVSNNLMLLYFLSFILGIFARGTSPAIKALAFDNLTEDQMRKGTAIHVVAGDSGSALGQLLFGFLVAWYGVNSPFFASAAVALFVGFLILIKPIQIYKIEN